MPSPNEPPARSDSDIEAERRQCLDAILASTAPRKVIVAGPGTGKSFTFKSVVDSTGGPNLALTFINALAADLRQTLGDLAETYTFHGFCRRLLHSTDVDGITRGVDYYPSLTILQADDLHHLGIAEVGVRDIEGLFHDLDSSGGVIVGSLQSGNYYNSVGHLDSVYRMRRHFSEHQSSVPAYAQIVVDEYQDFSLLEADFIKILANRSPILIVGDDDQALYGFKHASAAHIRDVARDSAFDRFELPYCSRCTSVLVAATHTIVGVAEKRGLLKDRLVKRYECYMPEKRLESELYPKIRHAHCSIERNNARYMAKYIHQRILEIPAGEVAESHRIGYPTVLVIGPKEFATRVHDYLKDYMDDIQLKMSSRVEIERLDGYRRLARDSKSRLGWRIILYLDPPPDVAELRNACLAEGAELGEVLPAPYRDRHLATSSLVRRLRAGESLTAEEVVRLEQAVDMPLLELRAALRRDEETTESAQTTELDQDAEIDSRGPSIVVTSLVGAKGLQCGHAFIVGINEGHFPRANNQIEDDEVCSLLVALTRARKSCTLVSVGRFGNIKQAPSAFLSWLQPHIANEWVDAKYFAALR